MVAKLHVLYMIFLQTFVDSMQTSISGGEIFGKLTERCRGRFPTFRGFQQTNCIEEKLFTASKYIGKQRLFFHFEENDFYRYNDHPTSLGGTCWETGVLEGENNLQN